MSSYIAFVHYFVYDLPSSTRIYLKEHFRDNDQANIVAKSTAGDERKKVDPLLTSPSILLDENEEKSSSSFDTMFGFLFTAYSGPNIILPILTGRLVDYFLNCKSGSINDNIDANLSANSAELAQQHSQGNSTWFAEKMLVFLTCIMALGNVFYVAGIYLKSWTLLITGRLLLGIGGESVAVVQARLATTLIPVSVTGLDAESECATIFGVMSAVAQMGTLANTVITSDLCTRWGLVGADVLSTFMTVSIIFMALGIIKLRNARDQKDTSLSKSGHCHSTGSPPSLVATTALHQPSSISVSSIVIVEPPVVQWARQNPWIRTLIIGLFSLISFCYNGSMYPFSSCNVDYYRQRFFPLMPFERNSSLPTSNMTLSSLPSHSSSSSSSFAYKIEVERAWAVKVVRAVPDAIAVLMAIIQLLFPRVTRTITRPILVTISGGLFFALGHGLLLGISRQILNSELIAKSVNSVEAIASLYKKRIWTVMPALISLGLAYTTIMWSWSVVPTTLPSTHHSFAYGFLTGSCNTAIAFLPIIIARLNKLEQSTLLSKWKKRGKETLSAVLTPALYGYAGSMFVVLSLTGFMFAMVLFWLCSVQAGKRRRKANIDLEQGSNREKRKAVNGS